MHAGHQHVNDDARLAVLSQELRSLGAVDNLKHSMPIEIAVLLHYKELL